MCAQTFHKLTRPHSHPPTKPGVFSVRGRQLPLKNHTAMQPRVLCLGPEPLAGSAPVAHDPVGQARSQVRRLGGHFRVPTGLALDSGAWEEALILGGSQSTELCFTLCTCETTTAEITQGFAAKPFLLEVFQTRAVEFLRESYDRILYVRPENNVGKGLPCMFQNSISYLGTEHTPTAIESFKSQMPSLVFS